jgi:hypothetical protein
VYRGRPLNQPITASPVPSHVRGLLAKVAGAMTTVEEYLPIDNGAVTASWLHRKPGQLNPPLFVREALNETHAGATRLHVVERAERFTYSRFTEDMGERHGFTPEDHDRNVEPWNNSVTAR